LFRALRAAARIVVMLGQNVIGNRAGGGAQLQKNQ
jgi:hypothetical protein